MVIQNVVELPAELHLHAVHFARDRNELGRQSLPGRRERLPSIEVRRELLRLPNESDALARELGIASARSHVLDVVYILIAKSTPRVKRQFLLVPHAAAVSAKSFARMANSQLEIVHHPATTRYCQPFRYGDDNAVTGSVFAARRAGFPAVTITCRNALDYTPHHHLPSDVSENLDADALDRAYRFCSELIELIDEEIGPDLERGEVDAFAEEEP